MNILALSCHSVLAYDECGLLSELGHYVFSPGDFVEKANPGDSSLRPKLEVKPEHLYRYREDMALFHACGKEGVDNKENLSVEFLKRFDCVIVMHIPKWIAANWERFKQAGTKVIWRTIGQSWEGNENELRQCRSEGLKIIRYSPRERLIPNTLGADALIRFYKDPKEFCGWSGNITGVVSVAQSMERRGAPCNFKWFEYISRPFPRKLYGADSETLSFGKGKVPFDEMRKAMQENRVYIYTGTWPASVCLNFCEAWMTGIPIVAIGPKLGHPHGWFLGHDLYEIQDLIENGVDGWCSDDDAATQSFIKELLNNKPLADKISAAGRAKAISIFGKDKIMPQWKQFLDTI